jgi:hypothetical protein
VIRHDSNASTISSSRVLKVAAAGEIHRRTDICERCSIELPHFYVTESTNACQVDEQFLLSQAQEEAACALLHGRDRTKNAELLDHIPFLGPFALGVPVIAHVDVLLHVDGFRGNEKSQDALPHHLSAL